MKFDKVEWKMSDWLNVGKIVNTHGVHGEVRVISITDFKEARYKEGNTLYAFQENGEKIPLTVVSWRQHKQFDLLKFKGYTNINDVEHLKGCMLKVHRDEVDDHLEEGEYYYYQIIGLPVFTEDGDELGVVKEILSPGANDVWVVERKDNAKEVLIPYIDDVVKKVDVNNKKIIIHLMEGLLDE